MAHRTSALKSRPTGCLFRLESNSRAVVLEPETIAFIGPVEGVASKSPACEVDAVLTNGIKDIQARIGDVIGDVALRLRSELLGIGI